MRYVLCCMLAAMLLACGDAPCGGFATGASTKSPLSALEPMPTAASPRQFAGGPYIDTDPDGVPAQVFRLYRAAFNRAADPTGLGFHIGKVEVYGRPLKARATFQQSIQWTN